MRKLNENPEKSLSVSAFKRNCGTQLPGGLGCDTQRSHLESGQLFFGSDSLGGMRKGLSAKNPDKITDRLAGRSQAGIADVVGIGFKQSRAMPRGCSAASEKSVVEHGARRLKLYGRSWTRTGCQISRSAIPALRPFRCLGTMVACHRFSQNRGEPRLASHAFHLSPSRSLRFCS
jgi:hypothetical protein